MKTFSEPALTMSMGSWFHTLIILFVKKFWKVLVFILGLFNFKLLDLVMLLLLKEKREVRVKGSYIS